MFALVALSDTRPSTVHRVSTVSDKRWTRETEVRVTREDTDELSHYL